MASVDSVDEYIDRVLREIEMERAPAPTSATRSIDTMTADELAEYLTRDGAPAPATPSATRSVEQARAVASAPGLDLDALLLEALEEDALGPAQTPASTSATRSVEQALTIASAPGLDLDAILLKAIKEANEEKAAAEKASAEKAKEEKAAAEKASAAKKKPALVLRDTKAEAAVRRLKAPAPLAAPPPSRRRRGPRPAKPVLPPLSPSEVEAFFRELGLEPEAPREPAPPLPPPPPLPRPLKPILSLSSLLRPLRPLGWRPAPKSAPDVLLRVEGPEILEAEEGGILWVESAGEFGGPRYGPIADALLPDVRYRLYIRSVYDREDGVAMESIPHGSVRGKLRAANVSKNWRPFPLVDKDHPAQLGRHITRGRLEAIRRRLASEVRPYTWGWLLSLVPVGEGRQRWLAMREGMSNCVAQLVRRELLRRSKALSRPREEILASFEARVAEAGAEEGDLAWLCRKLKTRIEVRGLGGELLWVPTLKTGESAYVNRGDHVSKAILVYRHNGHCFAERPVMPSPTSVRVYTGAERPLGEETVIEYEKRIGQRVAEVIEERGILRAFVAGSEIVDDAGVIHRPLELDIRLCRLDGRWGEGPDYRVTPTGDEGPDILHVGGAQSFAFKLWRHEQEVESLPSCDAVRCAWRAANFEAVPWSHPDGVPSRAPSYDMRAAYLSCDRRSERATGPGHDWALRCGFPAGGGMRRARVEDLSEVEGVAGCVRLAALELAEDCPEPIRAQLAYHCRSEAVWLPIPLMLYLRESGLMRSHRLSQVVYALERLEGLQFPSGALAEQVDGDFSERDLAVRMVGSCRYKSARQTLYTRDQAEAEFYLDHYAARDASVSRAGSGYLLSYDSDGPRTDHSHIRAYVLGYLFIAMAEAIRHVDPANLVAVRVDSLTLRRGPLPAEIPQAPRGTPKALSLYGQFLPKPAGVAVAPRPASEMPTTFAPDPDAGSLPPLSPDSIARHQLVFLDGPGGCGKTYRALRAFDGRRVVVLGKDNEHVRDLADPEKNPQGHPAKTYHHYFHLGGNDPAEWDEVVMGQKRPDVVIWDEVSVVPPILLRRALTWLRRVRACVVLAGDVGGQLRPIEQSEGESVGDVIRDFNPHVELMTADMRAAGSPGLQALKQRAWRQDAKTQMAALGELPALTRGELLESWSPSDTILAATNAICARLGPHLALERAARFSTAAVRMRFRPLEAQRARYRKRGGVLPEVVTPDGHTVQAVIGLRVEVPPEAAARADESLWVIDDVSTIYSCQGRTIKAPGRLIIVENQLEQAWCENAAYTAISRAERLEQLYRVRLV